MGKITKTENNIGMQISCKMKNRKRKIFASN